MDLKAAWSKATQTTKLAGSTVRFVALGAATHLASRWDAEEDRRAALRTPENLKALSEASKVYATSRVTAASAKSRRSAARKGALNPFDASRRVAVLTEQAAREAEAEARLALREASANVPTSLATRAVQGHAVHAVPAGIATWAMWADFPWPALASLGLIGAHAVALRVGRRYEWIGEATEGAEAGQTEEERQRREEERRLMERLDSSYWVQHAAERGLGDTVTGVPEITSAGVECAVRLDGTWSVPRLRAASEQVRALLGARTDLPMLIAPGPQGGWGVIRLRTRSAAPDGSLPWAPGDSWGVDMVTGDDVRIPLGHRMLIAGMSGAGKSIASRPLLFEASEGETHVLIIIDLKKVEGRLWDHRARVAYTPEQVVELVDELVAEMTERLDVLPKGQATLVPTARRPRITIVVDEGAEVMSACTKVEIVVGYKESGAPIKEKADALAGLDSIARMGRAACVDLWWMTQSPTYGDGVPRQIAKQLGLRIGLAVESPSEARVVFGESAQAKGWVADELPMPGVAMVRDGRRTPDPVKVRHITDDDVVALPDQPIWRRGDVATTAPVPVEPLAFEQRPTLRVIRSEVSAFDVVPAAPVATPEVEAADGTATNRARVLAAVVAGACTAREITDRTGLHRGTVSREVKALVESGAVRRGDDGGLMLGEVSA